MEYLIDVNIETNYFNIIGDTVELLQNKRLLISLSRIKYVINETKLSIPFRDETKIKTLQEIQHLLRKFGYISSLTENSQIELNSYYKEESNFKEFSENANAIRNNKFEQNQTLIKHFDEFQKVIQSKIKRPLYPLQLLSSFHMAFSQNSCNFAVPGAGKTSIVYSAYAYLNSLPIEDPRHVSNLLVVGPLSSFAPWENEFYECFGYKPNSFRMSGDIDITNKQKIEHLHSPIANELTLIYFEGVNRYQNDIIDFLKRNKTMVVVDEAHRIKNHEGVWGVSVTEIAKEAVSRIILTGTPIPNGYQDIYNLFKFIYPFKYKEILKFHYHNLEEMTNNNMLGSSRVQILKDNISPYFIRIKKDDLKLPPIEENEVSIEMDSYQREIYDFIESEYIPQFQQNSSATVKDVLNRAKLIRLRQASTNPSLLSRTLIDSLENNEISGEVDPNSIFTTDSDEFINDSEFFSKIINYQKLETPKKFKSVLSILNEKILCMNEKVIIWTIFIHNAKELSLYLEQNNINSRLLIGEVPQNEREATIKAFNDPSNNDFSVIIANPFSVAESISLHKGCHNAIYLERDYNCSNFIQSKDRIHRVGLDKDQITRYYYILSKDSIDEAINNRLRVKIERMNEIINDDIPLFNRIDDNDETDIINELISNYARRT